MSRDGFFYANAATLFPAADGAAAVVLAGSSMNSTPQMRCYDAEHKEQWTITFSHGVSQLELLEVEGYQRLLAVTTRAAELFLVDPSGTVRWEGPLHGIMHSDSMHVFELVAGSYGSGEAAIALRTMRGYFLYPINVEALPLAW